MRLAWFRPATHVSERLDDTAALVGALGSEHRHPRHAIPPLRAAYATSVLRAAGHDVERQLEVVLPLAYLLAVDAVWRGARTRLGLVAALAGALGFVATQSWIWRSLVASGFALATPTTDNEMGRFYMLTGAHFLHALVGSLLLLVTTVRALRSTPLPRLSVAVDVTAIVWHFVGAAWLAVWMVLTS